jgi:hypothetical protein
MMEYAREREEAEKRHKGWKLKNAELNARQFHRSKSIAQAGSKMSQCGTEPPPRIPSPPNAMNSVH